MRKNTEWNQDLVIIKCEDLTDARVTSWASMVRLTMYAGYGSFYRIQEGNAESAAECIILGSIESEENFIKAVKTILEKNKISRFYIWKNCRMQGLIIRKYGQIISAEMKNGKIITSSSCELKPDEQTEYALNENFMDKDWLSDLILIKWDEISFRLSALNMTVKKFREDFSSRFLYQHYLFNLKNRKGEVIPSDFLMIRSLSPMPEDVSESFVNGIMKELNIQQLYIWKDCRINDGCITEYGQIRTAVLKEGETVPGAAYDMAGLALWNSSSSCDIYSAAGEISVRYMYSNIRKLQTENMLLISLNDVKNKSDLTQLIRKIRKETGVHFMVSLEKFCADGSSGKPFLMIRAEEGTDPADGFLNILNNTGISHFYMWENIPAKDGCISYYQGNYEGSIQSYVFKDGEAVPVKETEIFPSERSVRLPAEGSVPDISFYDLVLVKWNDIKGKLNQYVPAFGEFSLRFGFERLYYGKGSEKKNKIPFLLIKGPSEYAAQLLKQYEIKEFFFCRDCIWRDGNADVNEIQKGILESGIIKSAGPGCTADFDVSGMKADSRDVYRIDEDRKAYDYKITFRWLLDRLKETETDFCIFSIDARRYLQKSGFRFIKLSGHLNKEKGDSREILYYYDDRFPEREDSSRSLSIKRELDYDQNCALLVRRPDSVSPEDFCREMFRICRESGQSAIILSCHSAGYDGCFSMDEKELQRFKDFSTAEEINSFYSEFIMETDLSFVFDVHLGPVHGPLFIPEDSWKSCGFEWLTPHWAAAGGISF